MLDDPRIRAFLVEVRRGVVIFADALKALIEAIPKK